MFQESDKDQKGSLFGERKDCSGLGEAGMSSWILRGGKGPSPELWKYPRARRNLDSHPPSWALHPAMGAIHPTIKLFTALGVVG